MPNQTVRRKDTCPADNFKEKINKIVKRVKTWIYW